ncbi:hypothetical protein VP01_3087g2 [Puccinia sorghi]|uniref:Uncharacterized protein n=1 Tax=Puccinia sorghi TaxID=27349 RepID=A0A0L6UZQ8_9BASI|nr:hypothetical protein VP01_3087g2 [Puccinia sorghi]
MELQAKATQPSQKISEAPTISTKKAKKTPKSNAPAQLTVTPKTLVNQRARSVTPMSAKKSPLQMTKQDYLAGFEHTKVIHIKILWGLIVKVSVPKPPSEDQLRAFYQRFQSSEEVKSAITGDPALLAIELIKTLKEACEHHTKIGKHMLHLSNFNIRYVHSSLSKLGLAAWMSNLDEQVDSLYNHQDHSIST